MKTLLENLQQISTDSFCGSLLHHFTSTNEESSSIMMMVSRELSAMRESETVLRELGDGVILLSSGSVEVGPAAVGVGSVIVGVCKGIAVELCVIGSTERVGEEET